MLGYVKLSWEGETGNVCIRFSTALGRDRFQGLQRGTQTSLEVPEVLLFEWIRLYMRRTSERETTDGDAACIRESLRWIATRSNRRM
eukprot:750519-Hanusia_phi.AAC.3